MNESNDNYFHDTITVANDIMAILSRSAQRKSNYSDSLRPRNEDTTSSNINFFLSRQSITLCRLLKYLIHGKTEKRVEQAPKQ